MSAGSIERTGEQLTQLRHQLTDDIVLATVAAGLSIAATQFEPSLAIPLFAGALTAAAMGARSFWRRWDLVERLALDRGAYAIPDVRCRGEKATSMQNRRSLAASARWYVADIGYASGGRVREVADELEALARDLDDESLILRPDCAVAFEYLLTDACTSPLFNTNLPAEDLHVRLHHIRAGFEPRATEAAASHAPGTSTDGLRTT